MNKPNRHLPLISLVCSLFFVRCKSVLLFTIAMGSTTTAKSLWRFGYGSNIGLDTLRQKKNLNPSEYFVGTIKGYELYFMKGLDYVEPGWAAVRPAAADSEVHGSAFLIPQEEADGLDRQEGGYNVVPCQFTSYNGEVVEDVGVYVPKKISNEVGTPSLRYMRLLRNGAQQGGLSPEWIQHLNSIPHYVTPTEVRAQTLQWIDDFQKDPKRNNQLWSAESLALHDGSNVDQYPVHSSVMEFVIQLDPEQWVFASWKGHNITRRNLMQFRGKSIDKNDIRYDQPGYRPIPTLQDCSDEEKEFLMQNLDRLLHSGGIIVGKFEPYLQDQKQI